MVVESLMEQIDFGFSYLHLLGNVRLTPALGLAISVCILFHALCRSRYEWLYLQGYWGEARFFRRSYISFEIIIIIFIILNLKKVLLFLDAI